MRKMKKFLAVALSAAMVLSVSVPAMAALERIAQVMNAPTLEITKNPQKYHKRDKNSLRNRAPKRL